MHVLTKTDCWKKGIWIYTYIHVKAVSSRCLYLSVCACDDLFILLDLDHQLILIVRYNAIYTVILYICIMYIIVSCIIMINYLTLKDHHMLHCHQ